MVKPSKKRPLRILIIGSLPPPVGGTSVSLRTLIDELQCRRDVEISVVNTSGIRGARLVGSLRLIVILIRILVRAFGVDVISAHLSNWAYAYLGLYIALISRLTNKPLVMRKFGGRMLSLGRAGNGMVCFVARRADVCLLETRMLVREAVSKGLRNASWYSNSRPRRQDSSERPRGQGARGREKCSRFVYIGHVREFKGIQELIAAGERLEDGASVDVYGPIFDDLDERIFSDLKRVKYRGTLAPEELLQTLTGYDAVVLPTKAQTEGYPGAIIESYMVGLPVIATTCGAIPEIVDETSGILIPPSDPDALLEAMTLLADDAGLYRRLCEGAADKAGEFDAKLWTEKFIAICCQVHHRACFKTLSVRQT